MEAVPFTIFVAVPRHAGLEESEAVAFDVVKTEESSKDSMGTPTCSVLPPSMNLISSPPGAVSPHCEIRVPSNLDICPRLPTSNGDWLVMNKKRSSCPEVRNRASGSPVNSSVVVPSELILRRVVPAPMRIWRSITPVRSWAL